MADVKDLQAGTGFDELEGKICCEPLSMTPITDPLSSAGARGWIKKNRYKLRSFGHRLIWISIAMSIAVQVGFGSYGIIFKHWQNSVNVLMFCLLRDTCSAFCLLGLAWYFAQSSSMSIPIPKRDEFWWFLALGGAMYLSQVMYLLGVFNVGPSVASVFQPLIPVFTAVGALLLGFDKLRPCTPATLTKFSGIVAGTTGAILMIVGAQENSGGGSDDTNGGEGGSAMLGIGCLFLNCSGTAAYVLVQQSCVYDRPESHRWSRRWRTSPVALTAWAYVFAAAFMWGTMGGWAVYTVAIGGDVRELWRMPVSVLIPLTYSVVIGSVMCYAFITHVNQILGPTVTTAFWPLQVLVATLMAFYFYGEVLAPLEIFGALLIVTGLFAVTTSKLFSEHAKRAYQKLPTNKGLVSAHDIGTVGLNCSGPSE